MERLLDAGHRRAVSSLCALWDLSGKNPALFVCH